MSLLSKVFLHFVDILIYLKYHQYILSALGRPKVLNNFFLITDKQIVT